MPELMIDLETLASQSPNARVVSIGLCAFELDPKIGDGILDVEDILVDDPDGVVEDDTVAWWHKQSDAARKMVFAKIGRFDLKPALEKMRAFVKRNKCSTIWSNGPTFDEIIIRAAWKRGGMVDKFPIPFYRSRCCRTAFHMLQRLGIPKPATPPQYAVKHNAAHDAANQALTVVALHRALPKR